MPAFVASTALRPASFTDTPPVPTVGSTVAVTNTPNMLVTSLDKPVVDTRTGATTHTTPGHSRASSVPRSPLSELLVLHNVTPKRKKAGVSKAARVLTRY